MPSTLIGAPLSEAGDTMSSVPTLRTTDLIGRDAELEQLTAQLGIRTSGAGASAAPEVPSATLSIRCPL